MTNVVGIIGMVRGLSPVAKAAVAATTLLAVVLALSLWAFAAALLGPSPEGTDPAAGAQRQAEEHRAAFERHVAQINGRSLFVLPAPPSAPPAPAPAEESPATATVPPSPATYGGPAIIGMVNDTVWFDNGVKLSAGGEKKGDLEVVRTGAPWEATLRWRGVEFAVPLFDRDKVVRVPEGRGPLPTPEPPPDASAAPDEFMGPPWPPPDPPSAADDDATGGAR